ncbi:hypothetical protein [Homoserinibacter gongjuensis]|uniref:hypothetical protein n=1 Tax=Homoserinibacter gongjuensis TaxID=1162968 RepID=UPI0024E15C1F|nr:hypothetical protein [Homoserinibacter gongjuensis]
MSTIAPPDASWVSVRVTPAGAGSPWWRRLAARGQILLEHAVVLLGAVGARRERPGLIARAQRARALRSQADGHGHDERHRGQPAERARGDPLRASPGTRAADDDVSVETRLGALLAPQ